MSQGLTDSSFKYHLESAKKNGVTRTEIAEILTHAAFYAGWPKAWAAFRMAKEVWTGGNADSVAAGSLEAYAQTIIFPVGKPNDAYAKYFIGQSYTAPVVTDGVPVVNVTFEPGCRNNWHSHTGGQLLLVTAGRGYYQEKGEPARELRPGDVVEIPADVVHWHGAAPDSWFSHLAVECNPAANVNTWLEPVGDAEYEAATAMSWCRPGLSAAAVKNAEMWFPGEAPAFVKTDPELAEVFGNFAFDEVQRYGKLDVKTRVLVTMASSLAQQAAATYEMTLRAALANGVAPVAIREVLYQAVPYVGMAKVVDYIALTNDFFRKNGVEPPLEPQAITTPETRMEKGLALQKEIFGDEIERMYETSPANQLHIQRALSGNCFGDYQTRTGLDVRTRELLTFSMLVSLGGCEPQVKGHIRGNVNVGNDKDVLLAVVTQLLPYIGYPRTLNAIACLNEVIPERG